MTKIIIQRLDTKV